MSKNERNERILQKTRDFLRSAGFMPHEFASMMTHTRRLLRRRRRKFEPAHDAGLSLQDG
jgi:hypothetical protein